MRFNQLPENDIISFLKHITVAENINLNDTSLTLIQRMYKSDVRSMINFIQSNQQNINNLPINIIDEIIWIQLYELIKNETPIEEIISFINDTSISYNIGKKSIIKDFFNYIIRHKKVKYSDDFFTFVENIVHFDDCDIGHYVNYSILTLQPFLL